MQNNPAILKYFINNKNPNFIKYFYGIVINQKDFNDFKEYRSAILHRCKNYSALKISKLTGISKRKLDHWIYEDSKPFVIRLLNHFLFLGKPNKNCIWLSINSTRGGLFTGPWIQVPQKIIAYKQILLVINQLESLSTIKDAHQKLNIPLNSLSKEIFFAYFLGFLIGDSSKTRIRRRQRITRRVHVRLSKAYPTNERLGDFVSLCVNHLNIRMKRYKDCPAGKRNTHPFYTWISQSSLLIEWIFQACLGLESHQLTTYDTIKSDWILDSPKKFKISFLQGLADSDGFVDFSSHRVGLIIEPNLQPIQKIFDSLNINTKSWLITRTKLWTLMINITDAYELPIFSPHVKSYRFQDTKKLFSAVKIKGHWPNWLKEKVDLNIREGLKGTKLVKKILNEEGIAIRTKSLARRVKKFIK